MKQVLVVGGGGGLGTALVKQLLDDGYKVFVAGQTKPIDERVSDFYRIELTNVDWPSLYCTIENKNVGPIDAIVFVAGSAVFGKTTLIPLPQAREIFELNFWACATAARTAAEYWETQKTPGKFVAVLSIAARRAVPFEAYYSASKAAAARFLECLQLEYADKKIEFLCAFPGTLKTGFRRRAHWYGLPAPSIDEGADVPATAKAVIKLLEGKRKTRVIGWRERTVDLADRVVPGLYERLLLRRRVRRLLK